jgi:hypothetical protein
MNKAFSNFEIVTLAVYLLGGNQTYVDTEDVAIKVNEISPGRFSWEKYPNQINIEKVRSSLSDAKKEKKGGYLVGKHSQGWILSGNPKVSQATDDSERLGKWSGGKGRRVTSKGGFRVEFKPMGKEGSRALYISNERTIYINLDHPQLIVARGNKSVEDPVFQRLAYEVAFSEYSIALAHELDQRNEFIDTSDPIVSIRESINRLARKAAQLFAV